jgi:hypothetical protein
VGIIGQHPSVDLVFPSASGYMLTSFGFDYLFKIYSIDSFKLIGNLPRLVSFSCLDHTKLHVQFQLWNC